MRYLEENIHKEPSESISSPMSSPMIEVKGTYDYHCSTCRRWITPAHGGIRCRKCNHLYCCHFECIPRKYCENPMYPGGVDSCQKCNGVILPQEPQKEIAKTTTIQVHSVKTPLEYLMETQLGRKTIAPPARHGREEKPEALKLKVIDKRLVGYYEL